MASIVVSGKKYEEAEQKIRDLELKLAASGKETSMLREEKAATKEEKATMTAELEKLKTENQELQKELDNVLVSVGRKDIEKAADEMVGKAKNKVGDYLKNLTS